MYFRRIGWFYGPWIRIRIPYGALTKWIQSQNMSYTKYILFLCSGAAEYLPPEATVGPEGAVYRGHREEQTLPLLRSWKGNQRWKNWIVGLFQCFWSAHNCHVIRIRFLQFQDQKAPELSKQKILLLFFYQFMFFFHYVLGRFFSKTFFRKTGSWSALF